MSKYDHEGVKAAYEHLLNNGADDYKALLSTYPVETVKDAMHLMADNVGLDSGREAYNAYLAKIEAL